MSRWKRSGSESLRCSFCHKGEGDVQKLISSPNDNGRVFICDECVAVCQAILEDDGIAKEARPPRSEQNEPHPVAEDPLQSMLVEAVERWIAKESSGADSSREFANLRAAAFHFLDAKKRS